MDSLSSFDPSSILSTPPTPTAEEIAEDKARKKERHRIYMRRWRDNIAKKESAAAAATMISHNNNDEDCRPPPPAETSQHLDPLQYTPRTPQARSFLESYKASGQKKIAQSKALLDETVSKLTAQASEHREVVDRTHREDREMAGRIFFWESGLSM